MGLFIALSSLLTLPELFSHHFSMPKKLRISLSLRTYLFEMLRDDCIVNYLVNAVQDFWLGTEALQNF